MSRKTIVGLTGVFGSGKSTVSHLFEELGAAVVNADTLAHEALWKGSEVYKKVAGLFPEAEKAGAGELDRKAIAEIVFRDAKRRKELEKAVHPYVRSRIHEEIVRAEEPVVVLEIPLLFETGMNQFCDASVVVSSPAAAIQKRLKEKGFSVAQIKARLGAQMPLKEKIKRADYAVRNSGTLTETKKQVKKIWQQLKQKQEKS